MRKQSFKVVDFKRFLSFGFDLEASDKKQSLPDVTDRKSTNIPTLLSVKNFANVLSRITEI